MATATTKPRRLTWRAGDDRIAHAIAPNALRTLCGERPVEERFAWPELRRCIGCASIAKEEIR